MEPVSVCCQPLACQKAARGGGKKPPLPAAVSAERACRVERVWGSRVQGYQPCVKTVENNLLTDETNVVL